MKKRLVLKDKKRFAVFIAIVIITTLAAVISPSVYGEKASPGTVLITVKSGDTLWSIAKKYRGSTEIRKYIYKIKKINNMDDCKIYKGMEIAIPDV